MDAVEEELSPAQLGPLFGTSLDPCSSFDFDFVPPRLLLLFELLFDDDDDDDAATATPRPHFFPLPLDVDNVDDVVDNDDGDAAALLPRFFPLPLDVDVVPPLLPSPLPLPSVPRLLPRLSNDVDGAPFSAEEDVFVER